MLGAGGTWVEGTTGFGSERVFGRVRGGAYAVWGWIGTVSDVSELRITKDSRWRALQYVVVGRQETDWVTHCSLGRGKSAAAS